MVYLDIQNLSSVKRLYSRNTYLALAERVVQGEDIEEDLELSLLFCDDPFIRELNARYRNKDRATDVLSFEQEAPIHTDRRLLGDIVISLETVSRYCNHDRHAMRREALLLFCHGLLHLLGYEHTTAGDKTRMQEKQAQYLDSEMNTAWH